MYVCLCTSVWVPTEARRGCQIIWSWNYILLWDVQCGCWESNSSLLKEQQAFVTTESSLQLYQLFIFKVSVALCCPRPRSQDDPYCWNRTPTATPKSSCWSLPSPLVAVFQHPTLADTPCSTTGTSVRRPGGLLKELLNSHCFHRSNPWGHS